VQWLCLVMICSAVRFKSLGVIAVNMRKIKHCECGHPTHYEGGESGADWLRQLESWVFLCLNYMKLIVKYFSEQKSYEWGYLGFR